MSLQNTVPLKPIYCHAHVFFWENNCLNAADNAYVILTGGLNVPIGLDLVERILLMVIKFLRMLQKTEFEITIRH
jgi:hypothetical protein